MKTVKNILSIPFLIIAFFMVIPALVKTIRTFGLHGVKYYLEDLKDYLKQIKEYFDNMEMNALYKAYGNTFIVYNVLFIALLVYFFVN